MAFFGILAKAIAGNLPNCAFSSVTSCFGSTSTDSRVIVEKGAFTIDRHTTTFFNCCNTEIHQEQNTEAWDKLSQEFVQRFGEEVADIIAKKYFPENQKERSLEEKEVHELQRKAKDVGHTINEMRCARMFHKYKEIQIAKGTSDSQSLPTDSPIGASTSITGKGGGSAQTTTPPLNTRTSVHSPSLNDSNVSEITKAAIRVIKRNNLEQEFNAEKLKKSLSNAPVVNRISQEVIDKVINDVITQLLNDKTHKIRSEDLETMVVEHLAKAGFAFKEPEIYHKMAPVMFKKLSAQKISPEEYEKFIDIFKAMHEVFSEHLSTPPAVPADFTQVPRIRKEHAALPDAGMGVQTEGVIGLMGNRPSRWGDGNSESSSDDDIVIIRRDPEDEPQNRGIIGSLCCLPSSKNIIPLK